MSAFVALVLAVSAVSACSKSASVCVDRDKVAGKMEQAVVLLQDGVKAATEHSVSASSQLSAAASMIESIADDLASAPLSAGEMRVAVRPTWHARVLLGLLEVVLFGVDTCFGARRLRAHSEGSER